jgi:flagella basal body P-ring formation protein FlgA
MKHFFILSFLATPAFADGLSKPAEQGPEGGEAAAFAPQVALPIVLVLKESIEVQEDRVVLSDVAECQGTKMICDEMYGVDLGKSPALGKSIQLKKEVIAGLAKSEWPKSQIELRGADSVKVSSLVFEITGRDLEVALQKTLDKALGNESRFKILVQVAHLNRNLKIAGSNNYYRFPEIDPLDFKAVPTIVSKYVGTRRFEVQIYASESKEMQSSTKILFTLQAEMFVPASAKDQSRGSFISSKDFSDRWVVLNRGQDSPIINIASFNGFKLNRRILAGEPIRESYLDVPRAIKRGQIVNVRLSTGQVEITSKAKATKDGAIGETIDVVLMGTQKRAVGKILAKDEVLIQ